MELNFKEISFLKVEGYRDNSVALKLCQNYVLQKTFWLLDISHKNKEHKKRNECFV